MNSNLKLKYFKKRLLNDEEFQDIPEYKKKKLIRIVRLILNNRIMQKLIDM